MAWAAGAPAAARAASKQGDQREPGAAAAGLAALIGALLLAGCATPAGPAAHRPRAGARRRRLAAGSPELSADRAHRGAQERAPAGGALQPWPRRRDEGRPRAAAGRSQDLEGRSPDTRRQLCRLRSRHVQSLPPLHPHRLPVATRCRRRARKRHHLGRRARTHRGTKGARTAPPPQDTALGGELGLHGEGPHWRGDSAELDWTFGCIAVRDHEIDFLAQRVKVGTPVWIVP